MTHAQKFFLLFVVWTLYNLCILHVKLFFVLSLQYFEKLFVCGFVLLFLCYLLLHLSVCFVTLWLIPHPIVAVQTYWSLDCTYETGYAN